MKPSKFFWICSSTFLISGCAGFQTKPYSVLTQDADFMSEYCQSGKQKKAYKTTVVYFTPNLEPKLSVDKANQKNRKLIEQKSDLLKKLFYMLGDENMAALPANQGDTSSWYLLVSDDEKDVLENIESEDSDTKYRLFTFIVKILNQNKVIVYQSNQISRRMNYDKGYSIDLSNLLNEYTVLLPKDIIAEITGDESDSRAYSTVILNDNGEIDLSKAIDRRGTLWKAYIKKFTSVKEASEDNSKRSIIELSLDLNAFCRYGRKISDLQSQ